MSDTECTTLLAIFEVRQKPKSWRWRPRQTIREAGRVASRRWWKFRFGVLRAGELSPRQAARSRVSGSRAVEDQPDDVLARKTAGAPRFPVHLHLAPGAADPSCAPPLRRARTGRASPAACWSRRDRPRRSAPPPSSSAAASLAAQHPTGNSTRAGRERRGQKRAEKGQKMADGTKGAPKFSRKIRVLGWLGNLDSNQD